MPYAQYTPPTPTRLNCRVESRRRCVLNSQLVGDSLDESEQFADNEVELRCVGGVYAPVVSRDPVSNFLRQSRVESRRRRRCVLGIREPAPVDKLRNFFRYPSPEKPSSLPRTLHSLKRVYVCKYHDEHVEFV